MKTKLFLVCLLTASTINKAVSNRFEEIFKEMHDFMYEQSLFMEAQSKRIDELFQKNHQSSHAFDAKELKNTNFLDQIEIKTDDSHVVITIHNIDRDQDTKEIKITALNAKNLESLVPLKNGSLELAVRDGRSIMISSSSKTEASNKEDDSSSSFFSSASYTTMRELPSLVEDLDKTTITFDKEKNSVAISMPKAKTAAKQLQIQEINNSVVTK
jgi:hypothetical protein